MILHIFTYVTAKKLSEAILDTAVKPAVMQPDYLSHRAGAMRRELPNSGFNGFDFDFEFRDRNLRKKGGKGANFATVLRPPLRSRVPKFKLN